MTKAEAVVKPDITEWLMKRMIHPSLERNETGNETLNKFSQKQNQFAEFSTSS